MRSHSCQAGAWLTAEPVLLQALKARLRRAAPNAVILEEFLGPQRLAELYSRTRLNVHPATADAFGMTIVEAAAQGAPSLVHDGGGSVGATDLLRAQHGEVFLTDLTADISLLAAHVASLLGDEAELAA
ncbi:glycos_transf_1 domain-containing protein, partial [Haematococcus lacustris]